MKDIILWVSMPSISLRLLKSFNPVLLWYDCTEDFSAWPGLTSHERKRIEDNDRWLTMNADVVTTVSRILYEEKKKFNHNAHWLPNAVDTDRFMRPCLTAPRELRNVQKPILIFVGALNEWAHDWGMLDEVATLRPDWTILLVGGLSVAKKTRRMLQSHPNIICAGQKPYQELPGYLAHSDVCFQFYRSTRINETRNSQKIFLYFAAGKPIVSTPSADAETYREHVKLAGNASEFILQTEKALNDWTNEEEKMRINLAMRNSWNQRAAAIVQLFEEVL